MAYSLVIIQSDLRQGQETAEIFRAYGAEPLAIGQTGKDALELVQKLRPDALLMEPFLPYYNCDEIAEILETEAPRTVKIAISDEKNDRIAEQFLNSGGDLFLIRPLDYVFCLKRLEKYCLLRKKCAAIPDGKSNERIAIRNFQMQLKMPISIHGFAYIQDAVELVLKQPLILHHMTSELYPNIAIRHHVSPACVERCIRTAVEKTFEKGDLALLQKHFFPAASDKGKISNKEFIGIFAELIRKEKGL